MSRDTQDQDGSGTPVSMRDLARYGVTPKRLRDARSAAEEGWSLMDSIDRETRDRAMAASGVLGSPAGRAASTLAHQYAQMMADSKSRLTEDVLKGAETAESLADEFAKTWDAGALARVAMHEAATQKHTLWDQIGRQDSALSKAIAEIGEQTKRFSLMDVAAARRTATADLAALHGPAVASVADSLSALAESDRKQSADIASKLAALGSPQKSAVHSLLQHGSMYAKSLFDHPDAVRAMDPRRRDLRADATPLWLREPTHGSLRSVTHEDASTRSSSSAPDVENLQDFEALTQTALGQMTFDVVAAAAGHLRGNEQPITEETFEDAAIEALTEADADFDPDVLPTVEEIAATEALVRLAIALRPDLSEDLALRKRVRWVVQGGGPIVILYLYHFHNHVYAAIAMMVYMWTTSGGAANLIDRAIAPGAYREDEEDDA